MARLVLAGEARALGHGGIVAVARASGASQSRRPTRGCCRCANWLRTHPGWAPGAAVTRSGSCCGRTGSACRAAPSRSRVVGSSVATRTAAGSGAPPAQPERVKVLAGRARSTQARRSRLRNGASQPRRAYSVTGARHNHGELVGRFIGLPLSKESARPWTVPLAPADGSVSGIDRAVPAGSWRSRARSCRRASPDAMPRRVLSAARWVRGVGSWWLPALPGRRRRRRRS